MSFFPRLIDALKAGQKHALNAAQRLFDAAFVFGAGTSVALLLTAGYLVPLVFGAEYEASVMVLRIYCMSFLLMCMGKAAERYTVATGKERKLLFITPTAAALNIALNLKLIPTYGPEGAAWATLISYLWSNILAFYVIGLREICLLQAKSVMAPIRYPMQLVKNGHLSSKKR